MSFRDASVGSSSSRIESIPTRNDPSNRTNLDPRSQFIADDGDTIHNHDGRPSSSSGPSSSGQRRLGTASNNRKRAFASTDTSEEGVRTKDGRSGAKTKDKTAQRAAQACLRCRRQKLRCLGGNPCERCVKTSNVCDFGHTGGTAVQDTGNAISTGAVTQPMAREEPAAAHDQGRDERLKLLETSVANLLAGLAEEPDISGQGYPHLEIFHEVVKHRKEPPRSTPSLQSGTSTRLPPPTHSRPLDPIRFGTGSINPVISPSSSHQGQQHSISPALLFDSSPNEPPYKAPRSLDAMLNHSNTTRVDNERGLPPQATESLYEAPFRSLVRPSARNSPERIPYSRDEPSRFDYRTRIHREDDDPVNTDIVSQDTAKILFRFFIDHCHPFLPIVDVAPEEAFITIRQAPPLFSAMIAIAARFYSRYNARRPPVQGKLPPPPIDPSVPGHLANLAEAHLSHTLLRRRYALTDVQAILLLAAWNLRPGSGSGTDAWVVTGHAARVSRRLGVHKILAQAAETARTSEEGSPGWKKLEAFIPQWRTWLCWFTFDGFLSLGFGRPQSTQFETVDEYGFLQMRLQGPPPWPGSAPSQALYGDVYIAGQVQLAQIGRDLINWGEMLADPEKAIYGDPRLADIFRDTELSVKTMFSDLNTRLDEWCRLWVWTGSTYALYLGPSARVARLQAEHMRLCLNSYVLKVGTEKDEAIGQCLRNALNAAVSTIQTHHESSQTDFGLSFATDYLTITLAQAAVFLVRITKAPQTVQAALKVENAVISHYLQMSIDLLELSDLSETRLGTNLAKTLRDIGRAAGVSGVGKDDAQDDIPQDRRGDERPPIITGSTPAPMFDVNMPNFNAGNPPNLEDFFQSQNELDLSYLLGLPTDGDRSLLPDGGNWSNNNPGNLASFTDFGFAMGGMGQGASSSTWNGTLDGLGTVFGYPEENHGNG